MKDEKDYIIYLDTDSLFLNIGMFLDDHLGPKWRDLPTDDIKNIVRNLSGIIEDYVNDNIYRDIQRKSYNSREEEFRIRFKQEMVMKSILFTSKKHYAMWLVDEDKSAVDKIKVVGLEIVRSDTPELVRPMLKEVISMILKGSNDEELSKRINDHKTRLNSTTPEEIAVNIGVHNSKKYIVDGKIQKGAPWHVKGLYNYRKLITDMKLTRKYDMMSDDMKVKCVYVKKNQFNMDTISFLVWPKEFDKYLQVDYEKMAGNFYLDKVTMLLEPMKKVGLITNQTDSAFAAFF